MEIWQNHKDGVHKKDCKDNCYFFFFFFIYLFKEVLESDEIPELTEIKKILCFK